MSLINSLRALALHLTVLGGSLHAVDYDIVYSRFPRDGDLNRIKMPEVFHPIKVEPGVDLMLLHPDGSEEVLVEGGHGAIVDPTVSFDGHWVYYSKFHDQRPESLDTQRPGDPSRAGADIYKIHLASREIVRLSHQEWTPNTGVVDWSQDNLQADETGRYYIGYGIFNLGPCPLPGGKVVFTSSRNGFLPNKGFTAPNLQLYTMDNDGRNVELMGHMNLGSALHPTVLTDGRIIFSSYESQGLRDKRAWGLWSIWPDGRHWEPVLSSMKATGAYHFQTELPNRDVAVVEYYNLNNNGFGTILAIPPKPTDGSPAFGSPDPRDESNVPYKAGRWWFQEGHPTHKQLRTHRLPFTPKGLYNVTEFAHGDDNASSFDLNGEYAGKVTHPSSAPDNSLLMVWSGGPANNLNRPSNTPTYDAGIYILPGAAPTEDPTDLICLKNDPNYNELQPRAVVPYSEIYGIEEPVKLPWYQNDGSETDALPAGTPFGIVGTASFYNRDTTPGTGSADFDGLDPFNTSQNGASSNWGSQGADAGLYSNSDIYAVRILTMEPTSHISRGPSSNGRAYQSHADERLRILGEIPLRKFGADKQVILDYLGAPDTSFAARIPADTPFTFQTLDKDGLALNTSQTWHQVRPGETRVDCGGCHGHSKKAVDFDRTAAAQPGYVMADLLSQTPLLSQNSAGETTVVNKPSVAVDVEYHRDIKPIFERSCVGCHSVNGRQDAQLALDDVSHAGDSDSAYSRLANDSSAKYGIPPVVRVGANPRWRQTNASRYIRKFQSRRSLLTWKVFGRRLDGWTNEDHPTESVPGDSATLPEGASANQADLDYTGTIMPPPDSGYPALSEEEKRTIARWIDLGCPSSSQDEVRSAFGWFADELRPTLAVSLPLGGRSPGPLTEIRIGAFDYYSGLNADTLSVTADFEINGQPAGTELAGDFSESEHVWTLPLDPAIDSLHHGILTVSVRDLSGNLTTVERTFTIGDIRRSPELALDPTPKRFGFSLLGEPQEQYLIESSDDMSHWDPMMMIQDFDGQQTVMPATEVTGSRFYRAVEMTAE